MAEATVQQRPDDERRRARLKHLEGFVRGYQLSWRVGGEALREIFESELYLLRAATFSDYARKVHKIGRRHAHDLVTAAKIAHNLRGRCEVVNGTETWPDEVKHTLSLRAALKLMLVEEHLQPKLLAQVIAETKTRSPTAKQIEAVAAKWPQVKVPKARKSVKPKAWRRQLTGGEVVVKVKAGVDLVALLEEALALARAAKAA